MVSGGILVGAHNHKEHSNFSYPPTMLMARSHLTPSSRENGGEGGIRTHGALITPDGFQDRSIKPLSHLAILY